MTDLGHVFNGLEAVIGSLDAVLLESNYDPEMLANGPYPQWLQQRVRGPGGHLSVSVKESPAAISGPSPLPGQVAPRYE